MEILVKLKHLIKYQNKYQSAYLDKKNGYRIWARTKENHLSEIEDYNSINEMLDGIKTEYNAFKDDKNNYKLLFNSKLNNYRFDLQYDGFVYHLMFSEEHYRNGDYEKLTNYKESIEVFSRLAYILKDFSVKLGDVEFCIGATDNESKNRLYEYFMKYTKSWYKKDTKEYDLGWALYFEI